MAPRISPAAHQVVQIGARMRRGRRGRRSPDRAARGSSAWRALRRLSGPRAGPGLAGAPGAGRQHAVEHVDAARDRADQVGGLADAHQVARPVGRQRRRRSAPRSRTSWAWSRRPRARRSHSRRSRSRPGGRRIRAADRDRCCPGRCRTGRSPGAGARRCRQRCGPAHRAPHRGRRLVRLDRKGRALVEHHGDGRIEQVLDRPCSARA